jgi:hypothetical protein
MQRRPFTNPGRSIVLPAIAALFLLGCSKDDPASNNSLCAGEAGVGIRVEGRAQPLDVCVSDNAVDALLTSDNHYDVSALLNLDDGSLVQVRMVFTHRADVPVNLRLVKFSDGSYQRSHHGLRFLRGSAARWHPIQSSLITGGSFRVTFNDQKVAVGTMENVAMDMTNVQNGNPAGERRIVEGFFSVSVASPAAASSLPTVSSR